MNTIYMGCKYEIDKLISSWHAVWVFRNPNVFSILWFVLSQKYVLVHKMYYLTYYLANLH